MNRVFDPESETALRFHCLSAQGNRLVTLYPQGITYQELEWFLLDAAPEARERILLWARTAGAGDLCAGDQTVLVRTAGTTRFEDETAAALPRPAPLPAPLPVRDLLLLGAAAGVLGIVLHVAWRVAMLAVNLLQP